MQAWVCTLILPTLSIFGLCTTRGGARAHCTATMQALMEHGERGHAAGRHCTRTCLPCLDRKNGMKMRPPQRSPPLSRGAQLLCMRRR